MTITVSAKNLWQDGTWVKDKTVTVQNGIITGIGNKTDKCDYSAEYIIPGIIDNHIHGGDGFGMNALSVEGMLNWTYRLAENGVCGVLFTAYGSIKEIRTALDITKKVMSMQENGEVDGARILGVHLEGPFLSNERPGAMLPKDTLKPSIEEYKKLAMGFEDIIKEITLAPEISGACELVSYLKEQGVKVLAGHTDCKYETAVNAFNNGIGAMCHTFNACRPINHREPGIVTAALTNSNVYCEMISDLVHLHPATLNLMYKLKGNKKIMVISDAVITTNMPDGVYNQYNPAIYVKDGISRTVEGDCLDGGGCYTSYSVKRLVNSGIPFEDAVYMTSVNPAIWLGLPTDEVTVGNNAFISAFDGRLNPLFTVIGRSVSQKQINL